MEKALTLRLPSEIHDRATAAAESLGLTLSAYIRLALVEHSRWKLKDAAAASRALPARNRTELTGAQANKSQAPAPVRRPSQSLNSPCACGSGLKFKRCCGQGVI